MRLITLIAGYAAGLAIAMKYRKNTPVSKLKKLDPTKSKLDLFLEEIVDIHKSAFSDIKNQGEKLFADVDSFDVLKSKIQAHIDSFQEDFEAKLSEFHGTAKEKQSAAITWLDKLYAEKKHSIDAAQKKASTLEVKADEKVDSLFDAVSAKLDTAYQVIRKKLQGKS